MIDCSNRFSYSGEHINMERLRIRYLDDQMIPLVPPDERSDWVDLRSRIDISMKAGEVYDIPLGVAIELPPGYEALIAPRSSTAKQFGLLSLCTPAVIDNSYRGDEDEWHFPALAIRDTQILQNDRICQFRILASQPYLDFRTVDFLGNPSRGGRGSSGIR